MNKILKNYNFNLKKHLNSIKKKKTFLHSIKQLLQIEITIKCRTLFEYKKLYFDV